MKRLGYINSKRAMEPNYSAWTLKAIYDTGLAFSNTDTLAIRVNGNVAWEDQDVKELKIISPTAALLATLDNDLSVADLQRIRTLADRYFLLPKYTGMNLDKIVVQEGITELWEKEITGDITDPITEGDYTVDDDPLDGGLMSISPNGEWIVAMVKEAASGFGLIFIYKGSG